MPKILIVYHSQSGNTRAAAEAVAAGAKEIEGTEVLVKEALQATAEDLESCDGVAVGSPDYFSYMAGGLKDFFDRTYYPTMGKVTDKPCVIFITHGGGGSAVNSVKNICRAFKFREIAPPVLCQGRPDSGAEATLRELGKKLAQAVK